MAIRPTHSKYSKLRVSAECRKTTNWFISFKKDHEREFSLFKTVKATNSLITLRKQTF